MTWTHQMLMNDEQNALNAGRLLRYLPSKVIWCFSHCIRIMFVRDNINYVNISFIKNKFTYFIKKKKKVLCIYFL